MALLNTRPDASVPPITLLMRFLYIGSDKCSFNKFDDDIAVANTEIIFDAIINMGEARPILPITTIRKVYQSKLLLRTNETMFALAYCVRQNRILELRTLAYKEALDLIGNQSDFLMFIKYCVELMGVVNSSSRGFGKGMRKFVSKWYGKHTNVELADMFGEHRGLYKWTHKDVIALARLNPRKRFSTAANVATTSTPANVAATSTAAADNTVAVLADREHVFQFNFKHGQEYLNYLNELSEPLGQGALRMKALQQFKTNESTDDAVHQIETHGFTLNQMPAALLERLEIWDALLPSIAYHELIEKLFTLKDLGFLNPNQRFVKKYIKALKKCETEDARICPIDLFIKKRLYENNIRYLATTKKEHYARKMVERGVQINDAIKKQLNLLFEHVLLGGKRAPAHYFITMDLRVANKTKHVLRNEYIKCDEAMTLLAYSILQREKNALVYQYTDQKDVIKAMHLPRTSFEAAKKYCDDNAHSRTYQSLALPLSAATHLSRKIDVFVVIVDSVARFSRQGQVPADEFLEYKQKFNKTAKFVVVNLCRSKPDLVTSSEYEAKGFFEIVGFDENTPKLLYALGKGAFS